MSLGVGDRYHVFSVAFNIVGLDVFSRPLVEKVFQIVIFVRD